MNGRSRMKAGIPIFLCCWCVPALGALAWTLTRTRLGPDYGMPPGTQYHSMTDLVAAACVCLCIGTLAWVAQAASSRKTRLLLCIPLGVLLVFLCVLAASTPLAPMTIMDPW